NDRGHNGARRGGRAAESGRCPHPRRRGSLEDPARHSRPDRPPRCTRADRNRFQFRGRTDTDLRSVDGARLNAQRNFAVLATSAFLFWRGRALWSWQSLRSQAWAGNLAAMAFPRVAAYAARNENFVLVWCSEPHKRLRRARRACEPVEGAERGTGPS